MLSSSDAPFAAQPLGDANASLTPTQPRVGEDLLIGILLGTIAGAIARSKAFSLAGGGDTLAAIEKYGVEDGISYISTGGGAFLEFVEGKTLPAVSILESRAAG